MNLHDNIMNIPCKRGDEDFKNSLSRLLYKEGHRDARHAAAELSLQVGNYTFSDEQEGSESCIGAANIYRQHAAERLRADIAETRWQAKTKECNALREIIATLNEKLEGVK